MSDEATKDSQCTCVSKIIKFDPNLLQRRESLFASSEAQSIIEQMTGVSCNGQVILKKTTESQAEDPTEEAPAVETSSTEGKEDNKRVAMTNKSKAGKEREKHTMADVASKVMNSKLYTNDRTTRAVKKWRAFRTREERRLAGEDGQEKHEAKDDKDEKTDEAQSKVGIGDSSPSTASTITTTSAGANTTNTKFSLSRQDENDSNDDIDSDSESDSSGDSSDDSETKPTDQPRVATPTPPKSPVLHRPARARFGRRYSMPLNVMTPAPPRLSPAVSPPHGSPKASQESSPNRRPHVTAAITKLQNNREKLSMLFDKRSEVISSLDAESEVVGIGKRVTRLCNRRASDSMSTLSDFLRKQQISLTGSSTGRLLQRRGSVGTNILARNTRTPAVDSSQISPVAPGPNDDNKIRSGRPEFKSRSCEDVAIPNPPGQLHPPPPFHGGRRGSVCVGQIARVRDGTPPELQSPRRPPADGETPLGLICSSKKNVPQERNPDGDSGKDKDTANHKSPPQRYMKNRRGSVSLAHIAHAREMLQCKTLGNSESQKNGLSKSVPLTLANIEVHNTLLSPFSFQFFSDRIPTTAGAGPVKSEDSPEPAEVSTKPAANQAQGGVHVREGEPKLEGPETAREMGTSSLRQGSSPRRASTPAVPVSERKYSLFLRTDSEIREDIENEIQERVARRRRELMAVRCVSAKGAQRLEARALAQSAAGRLKRNLHEVTKQRKTKELMQIEEERNRLLKQMMLLS